MKLKTSKGNEIMYENAFWNYSPPKKMRDSNHKKTQSVNILGSLAPKRLDCNQNRINNTNKVRNE